MTLAVESLVHALIEDLAAGKLVESSQFKLIDEQKNIKIPSYLVYLTGCLVVMTTSSSSNVTEGLSLTPRDHQQFESLQKIFSKSQTVEMPIFRLSPRLCPTKDQLAAIQADLNCKRQELEIMASQAAQDLLSSAKDERAVGNGTNTAKSKSKKKKKTSNKSKSSKMSKNDKKQQDETQEDTAETQNHHDENLPPPSLEEVLSQIQTETTSTISQDEDSDALWIPVSSKNMLKEKKKQTVIRTSTQSQPDVQPISTNNNKDIEKHSTKASQHQPSSSSSLDDHKNPSHLSHPLTAEHTSKTNAVAVDESHSQKPNHDALSQHDTIPCKNQFNVANEPAAAAAIGETTEQTSNEVSTETSLPDDQPKSLTPQPNVATDTLQERIRQLEQALEEKEQELQNEKQSHAKKLSQKQQQFDDQIQALQLRLYISETRLKTFEDALEQHVQAVANNVSTTLVESLSSSSPRRTVWARSSETAANEKEGEPPSPLISRMLSFQKKQKDGAASS